ncbi:hypothetical protein EVG20_g3336 [Dentipellis fragilis]|uniref:Uncharacterized protein n=1 Tax=Dentipellis fragilis TaxID=205917 RepID=A0A4Y9Z5A3_9AGAM|nr:hypothetical protein EVG20_g3336 [Dentipellis fragilis]
MSTFTRAASLLTAVVVPLFLAQRVVGQLSAPDCQPGFQWSYNSLNQTPCLIAAYVEAACDGGQFSIPPLAPNHHYTGPTAGQGNPCLCNTVAYSLISACDACQGNAPLQWSEWAFNCSSTSPDGTLPISVPSGTRIPQWAYQNVTGTDLWNNQTAFNVGDGVESTATTGPTGSSSVSMTSSPGVTGSQTSAPNSGGSSHKSHAGAIAGGVVGGVVGAALLAGLAVFFFLRYRRSHLPPSAAYTQGGAPPMSQPGYEGSTGPFTAGTTETPRKFYDPSDPSTFPTSPSPSSPTIRTTANTYNGGMQGLQPNRSQYNGLPEV